MSHKQFIRFANWKKNGLFGNIVLSVLVLWFVLVKVKCCETKLTWIHILRGILIYVSKAWLYIVNGTTEVAVKVFVGCRLTENSQFYFYVVKRSRVNPCSVDERALHFLWMALKCKAKETWILNFSTCENPDWELIIEQITLSIFTPWMDIL
jgi:hypothetical protein